MSAGRYDFEVTVDGVVTSERRRVFLCDLGDAWPHVYAMAEVAPRGAKIRVLDRDGRIVILTGAATMRALARKALAA